MRRLSRRRSARYESGEYLIDGPTLLADALDSGVIIERIYVEADALDSEVLNRAATTLEVRAVANGALAKVLDVVTPNRMVAVARLSTGVLGDILEGAHRSRGLLLVLVDVADPGNAGTLVRAGEAAGCCGLIMVGSTTDPFSPKTVRASAGSLFRLPVAVVDEASTVLQALSETGIQSWATVVRGGLDPGATALTGATAVVIGNEAHGLTAELVDQCSGALSIPMAGAVESLNAAMAGTVILFEAARQRRSG